MARLQLMTIHVTLDTYEYSDTRKRRPAYVEVHFNDTEGERTSEPHRYCWTSAPIEVTEALALRKKLVDALQETDIVGALPQSVLEGLE